MTVVAYYILEAVKFLVVYLLGMSMRASADWRRRLAAGCLVLLTGILMNFLRLSSAYPVLYLFFALLLFYLLIEQAAFRNVVIVFWAVGVIFSVDTISYVLVRLIISGKQRSRRKQVGYSTDIREEFNVSYREMIDAGVSEKLTKKLMKKTYKYFDSINAFD